jgi:hypothetical protein
MDIGHDRIHEFGLFLFRIGVVHPHVADAAEFVGDPKVEADRLGVADVQITVRLRREAGVDFRVLSAPHIFCDDIADEIGRGGIFVDWFRHACYVNHGAPSCHPARQLLIRRDMKTLYTSPICATGRTERATCRRDPSRRPG